MFDTELKVTVLFVGPTSKWSSGPSQRRWGPLCSPLGRGKQGQRVLFKHWASKPPDCGLFCTGPPLSLSLWSCEENGLQLLKGGRSTGFSHVLHNLLVHFLQRPFVAAETSPGSLQSVVVPYGSVVHVYTNQWYLASCQECHTWFNPKRVRGLPQSSRARPHVTLGRSQIWDPAQLLH